jgi:hypothetical protein
MFGISNISSTSKNNVFKPSKQDLTDLIDELAKFDPSTIYSGPLTAESTLGALRG